MPIFRVKSVKIYTGQKNLHWRRRPRRRQLSGMSPQQMQFSVIIEVYSSNIANTYLSLGWIPRVRARARTITPAITWSRGWKSNRAIWLQNCCTNLKNKISATSFAKFLPALHHISQQDMIWGGPCRSWRHEDRPDYPGSWPRSAPQTILLQKILMCQKMKVIIRYEKWT